MVFIDLYVYEAFDAPANMIPGPRILRKVYLELYIISVFEGRRLIVWPNSPAFK